MGQRGAVGPVQLPRHAPGIGAKLRNASGKLDGRLVEHGDSTLGIGDIDRRWQSVDQLAHLALAVAQSVLPLLPAGNVLEAVDGAVDATVPVPKRGDVDEHGQPLAVGALDDHLLVDEGFAGVERGGHGALVVWQVGAVGAV